MAAPAFDPALARQRLAEVAAHGGSVSAAARASGLNFNTYRSQVRLARAMAERPVTHVPPPPEPLAERERRRFREENARMRRERDEALDRASRMEALRAGLFGLTEAPLDPATFRLPAAAGALEAEIPVLFTSDFQWGEVIKLAGMGGLNAYNRDIASARYRRLIEATIELCTRHHAGAPPPAFYYLRGGDSISGEIHDELERTNDLLSIPALKEVAEHEAWGIETLARAFGCPIIVPSTPGNHDRSTRKPHSKGYVETSYDSLITWYLERHFAGRADVTFLTPAHPDTRFRVHNTEFLMTHGDQIGASGGQGFIGPAATITRGMKKLVDYYASIGDTIDVVLLGHFHTSLKLDYGFSNGSLPGYSEFARRFRMRAAPPTQWLLHVHPKRGVVVQREVMVGGAGEGLLCDRAVGAR